MVMIRIQNYIAYKFIIKVVVFDSLSTINLMYFFVYKKLFLCSFIVKMKSSSWFLGIVFFLFLLSLAWSRLMLFFTLAALRVSFSWSPYFQGPVSGSFRASYNCSYTQLSKKSLDCLFSTKTLLATHC